MAKLLLLVVASGLVVVGVGGGPGWGRPTKLTAEIRDLIPSFVRDGSPLESAAITAGLHRSTLYDWQRRGRVARARLEAGERIKAGERRFIEFLDAIDQARADAEVSTVHLIRHAIRNGDVKVAQWYLERAHPDRWGRPRPEPRSPAHTSALEGRESDERVRWLVEQLKALNPAERAQLVWNATIAAIAEVDVAAELERGRQLREANDARTLSPESCAETEEEEKPRDA